MGSPLHERNALAQSGAGKLSFPFRYAEATPISSRLAMSGTIGRWGRERVDMQAIPVERETGLEPATLSLEG